MFYYPMNTPAGIITILWQNNEKDFSIERIMLPPKRKNVVTPILRDDPNAAENTPSAIENLAADITLFFAGKDPARSLTYLAGNRLSPFQTKVLDETTRIPRGKVMSYGTLASRIGHSGAARAVGTALAHNPFPLLIPCHRVVRASGRIGRFGGGSAMKRLLLKREGVPIENDTVHPFSFVY